MKKSFGPRLRKLEQRISPERTSINCYADRIRALQSGEKIDYNSTPYLRRCAKSIQKFLK
jgi:hypothetical protein